MWDRFPLQVLAIYIYKVNSTNPIFTYFNEDFEDYLLENGEIDEDLERRTSSREYFMEILSGLCDRLERVNLSCVGTIMKFPEGLVSFDTMHKHRQEALQFLEDNGFSVCDEGNGAVYSVTKRNPGQESLKQI